MLLLLLLLLALPAGAQETTRVVVLPLVLRGEYRPLTQEQFTEELRKLTPNAAIVQAGTAGDQPPTPEEAKQLCAAHQANYVCWMTVRFRPQLTPVNASQADLLPGLMSMSGAARLWIWAADPGTTAVDEPVSVVRTARVEVGGSLPEAAQALAGKCAHDLAQQIVTVSQHRAAVARVAGWPEAPQGGAGSAAVLQMCQSADRYRKAVRSGDQLGATDAQRAAHSLWPKLSSEEKAQVEQRYPGTTAWMAGNPYFDVNGFWR